MSDDTRPKESEISSVRIACTHCGRYITIGISEYLDEYGAYLVLKSKSDVLRAAGYTACLLVLGIAGIYYHGFVRNQTTGIDLGLILTSALAFLAVVAAWAFPKGGKK